VVRVMLIMYVRCMSDLRHIFEFLLQRSLSRSHVHCGATHYYSEIYSYRYRSGMLVGHELEAATHSGTLTFTGPKPPESWALKCALPLPDVLHTFVCDTIVCMAQVDRFSVTMPPELGEGVRQAAARQGTSVSTWLTEAAADKLRNELLGAALDQWEAEDGSFTQAELEEAASRLGLAPRSDVA